MERAKSETVRDLLGHLNDSQSTEEASYFADEVVKRCKEDIDSVSEFLHCGHVDWDDLLAEKMKAAGYRGGRLGYHLTVVQGGKEKAS
jgi:hypothetical protein